MFSVEYHHNVPANLFYCLAIYPMILVGGTDTLVL